MGNDDVQTELSLVDQFQYLVLRFQSIDSARRIAVRHALPEDRDDVENVFMTRLEAVLDSIHDFLDTHGAFSSEVLETVLQTCGEVGEDVQNLTKKRRSRSAA